MPEEIFVFYWHALSLCWIMSAEKQGDYVEK
jgi:hypothetical protein